MLQQMLVCRYTHVKIARFKTVYDSSQKQLLLRSKSAPTNINKASLYNVSGLKSSKLIGMKRCNAKGLKGLCWVNDVRINFDHRKNRHRSINQKVQVTSMSIMLIQIPSIHRHRPSALQCFHYWCKSHLTSFLQPTSTKQWCLTFLRIESMGAFVWVHNFALTTKQ